MPASHQFEHLPLLLRYRGRAKLRGGGSTSPQTVANRNARTAHSASLNASAQGLSTNWRTQQTQRQAQNLPVLPAGKPILVKVDPGLDLDVLRDKFDFEIVAEQEEGFVLVASEDIDLTEFTRMVNAFAVAVHGSATIASVHRLYDDPNQADRLQRVLSERLLQQWSAVTDERVFVVDVGVACTGTKEIPDPPERGKRDSDADWARKQSEWAQRRTEAYDAWETLCTERQSEVIAFVRGYGAEIMNMVQDDALSAAVLPDSFTVRLKIRGIGFKDLVLNYPFIFEVVEPEDIALPQYADAGGAAPLRAATPVAPPPDAPAVCVIDSGVQEGHVLLAPAIDTASSRCFLPGMTPTDIGDFVAPAGHGTRVAGALIYGESVAHDGSPQLPFWVQNARVLNEHNRMPVELFPPTAIRGAVEHFHLGARGTRIFNQSVNSVGYSRTRYMSAWAAEIDSLSNQHDILIVQSAGNLPTSGNPPFIGTKEHLAADRHYSNAAWEKLSIFLNFLIPKLPAPQDTDFAKGILEAIDMDSYRSERQEAIKIALPDSDALIDPVPTSGGGGKPEPELDRLSSILRSFNDQFGNIEWKDEDKIRKVIAEELPAKVGADKAYQNAMKNSDKQNARIEHDKALARVMTELITDHTELFKQFSDNPQFKKWLLDTVFGLTYDQPAA